MAPSDKLGNNPPLLEVKNLRVEFPTRRGTLVAVDDVSLEIAAGEVLGVVGESGAGKSMTGTAIIGLLEPRADHLVVEAWLDASCWGKTNDQVVAATGRTKTTEMEVLRLMQRSQRLHLQTHTLPMTCIEYDAVVDASGHVDFLLLLELITQKLADTTRSLLAKDRAVIVYGGALHNDLYPRWPLDSPSCGCMAGPGSITTRKSASTAASTRCRPPSCW